MPPKKAKTRSKRAASLVSEDEQPKAKQAKGAKGGKKVKAEPIADEEEDKGEVEVDSKQNGTKKAKEEPKFTEAQVAKAGTSRVPLDEECPLRGYRVYIDPDDGIIYDAALNQTNAGANNNKFYRIQVSSFVVDQFISADYMCEASRERT
jgi:poly [ADP-ribose] polymerase 2/3/4